MTITVVNPERLPLVKEKLMEYLIEDMLENQKEDKQWIN